MGMLRFIHRLIRSLVLPSNAGPNDERMVIGPDIPVELQAAFSGEVIAAILSYDSAGRYHYDAACALTATAVIYQARGFYNGVSVSKTITENIPGVGADVTLFGTTSTGGAGSEIVVVAGDTLRLDADSAYTIDGRSAPRGMLGVMLATGAGVALVSSGNNPSAGNGETAVTSASWSEEPTFVLPTGRVFVVHAQGLTRASGTSAANARNLLRIRKGAQTTSGTELAAWKVMNGGDTSGANFSEWAMFVNNSGSDVSTKLSLTVAYDAGVAAGQNGQIFVGGGATCVYVSVYDVGALADNPDLSSNLPSV